MEFIHRLGESSSLSLSLSCQRCINFRASSYQPSIIHHFIHSSCNPTNSIYSSLLCKSTHLFFVLISSGRHSSIYPFIHPLNLLISSPYTLYNRPSLIILSIHSPIIKSAYLFLCASYLLVITKLSRPTIAIVSLCYHRASPPPHHSPEGSPPHLKAT